MNHERTITLPEGTFDAILFDCDGTLVESAPAWHLAICHALEGHSQPMPADWYYARLGLSPVGLMDVYEKEIGPLNIPRQDFFHRCVTGYRNAAHALEEVTVVADVARQWHGKVPMAVVTNAQRPAVEGALAATGLRPLFHEVISVEDVTHGKPAPDIYLKAAERLGLESHRCLVLEDSHEGLLAAHRAGMRAIDIRNHWTPKWKR